MEEKEGIFKILPQNIVEIVLGVTGVVSLLIAIICSEAPDKKMKLLYSR